MRAHEAGALHGEIGNAGPGWLRTPDDVNALMPALWPSTVERSDAGSLTVAGLDVRQIAADFGTPAYVLDEADLRHRAREFAAAFAGWDVYYAGKAFCAKAVIRTIAEEGLNLDVCTGGELATALAAGMPPERIGFHGNNKSVAELSRALDAGVGRIVVDSTFEIDRLTRLARVLGLQARIRDTYGVELPELDLGGGFGIAYTSQDDPSPPTDLAKRMRKIVEDECEAARLLVPRLSIEPGRAIVGPAVFTLYEVGTVKDVDGIRTYVSVDGGMRDRKSVV